MARPFKAAVAGTPAKDLGQVVDDGEVVTGEGAAAGGHKPFEDAAGGIDPGDGRAVFLDCREVAIDVANDVFGIVAVVIAGEGGAEFTGGAGGGTGGGGAGEGALIPKRKRVGGRGNGGGIIRQACDGDAGPESVGPGEGDGLEDADDAILRADPKDEGIEPRSGEGAADGLEASWRLGPRWMIIQKTPGPSPGPFEEDASNTAEVEAEIGGGHATRPR